MGVCKTSKRDAIHFFGGLAAESRELSVPSQHFLGLSGKVLETVRRVWQDG
jgi:hypothetical protein